MRTDPDRSRVSAVRSRSEPTTPAQAYAGREEMVPGSMRTPMSLRPAARSAAWAAKKSHQLW